MLQVRTVTLVPAIISTPPFWLRAGGPACRGSAGLRDRPLAALALSAPRDPGRTGAGGPDWRCFLRGLPASDSPARDSGICVRLPQLSSQWIPRLAYGNRYPELK